jgi:TonB family protein
VTDFKNIGRTEMSLIARLLVVATVLGSMMAAAQATTSGVLAAQVGAPPAVKSGEYCQPDYPSAALEAKAEGATSLNVEIDPHGRIASAQVVKSAGDTPAHKLLDQAIAQALVGCLMYRPKLDAKGQAIGYPLMMQFHWRLPPPDGKPLPKAHPARLSALDAACRPAYPPAALRVQAEGTTRLRVTLDAAGHVTATEVIQSAGETAEHKLLDQVASEALARCPYTPGTDWDGKPIGTMLDLNYTWKLD